MKRFKYLALAALMAFAACDEGEDPVVIITGSITGVVTIDGGGASGVTVTLSTGSTATTDGSGSYTFSNVEAGSYTVTISGFANDATFGSTSQAATISTSGQVVTVNFSGQYIKTSAIIGTVTAGGSGLGGVIVSIGSGNSTTTDANGVYSFGGLRAGSYTVTISGFDATMYVFTETQKSATLGVGESEVVNFSGALATTARITGVMFLDENAKNNALDTTEDPLMVAGVLISLEGAPGQITTTETDANGAYAFEDLAAGTYRVSIDASDADIPGTVALGDNDEQLVTVTVGATGTANWPFDIIEQTLNIYAFYGLDAVNPGVAPTEGVIIDLYPTEVDFDNKTNRLGRDTTDAGGMTSFTFLRADDTGPVANTSDGIVFAERILPLPANHVIDGEISFEIEYDLTELVAMAPDTFDVVNAAFTASFNGVDGLDNPLEAWVTRWYRNDTTAAAVAVGALDTLGAEARTFVVPLGALPDTFYMRLSGAQPLANGHGFTQMASAGADGAAANSRNLMVVHDGFSATATVKEVGTETVNYTDQDLMVRVHHEADDVAGYSDDDDFLQVVDTEVELFQIDGDGDTVSMGAMTPTIGTGWATFTNLPVDSTYYVEASSNVAWLDILDDAIVDGFAVSGLQQVDTLNPLEGDEGPSTFAHKNNNLTVRGLIQSVDGAAPAEGVEVRVMAADGFIQPNVTDTTVETGDNGIYRVQNLREGPYVIHAMANDSWEFFDTLEVASTPLSSGSDDNDDERSAMRDAETFENIQVANFEAYRIDTEIRGTVINDRDADGNVIDPNEALAGAVMNLYLDGDMIASDTTDASGAYSFAGLIEDTYVVQWMAGSPDANQDVLRALNTDSAVVATSGSAVTVGSTSPTPLPGWNYATTTGTNLGSTHFAFLFKNTTASGTITDGADPVSGMVVSLRRCNASTGAVSPPAAVAPGVLCTTYLGTTVNTSTDASGNFSFTGLVEGVYEITPSPTTVGGFTVSTPAQRLYLMIGSGDVENATFVAS